MQNLLRVSTCCGTAPGLCNASAYRSTGESFFFLYIGRKLYIQRSASCSASQPWPSASCVLPANVLGTDRATSAYPEHWREPFCDAKFCSSSHCLGARQVQNPIVSQGHGVHQSYTYPCDTQPFFIAIHFIYRSWCERPELEVCISSYPIRTGASLGHNKVEGISTCYESSV